MAEIKSPVIGKIKKLSSIKDEVFSKKMMGDGVVIEQTDGKIYAPVAGRLVTVFPTGHAFGIMTKDKTNVLVHIGVDTVNLKGEGFITHVKQGKKVKVGKLIGEVDLDKIKGKVPSTDVIVIITQDSETTIESKKESGNANLETTIIQTK